MRPLSLRFRLTLWYVLALIAVLVVCGVVVSQQLDRITLRRIDRELASQAQTIANMMEEEFQEQSPMDMAVNVALQAIAQRERAFAVFDDKGTVIGERLDRLPLKQPIPDLIDGQARWTAYGDLQRAWRVRAQRSHLSGGQVTIVAGSLIGNTRSEADEAMMLAFPIALLIAGLGGLWLASIGLRPITAMADQASKIPLAGLQDLGESDRTDELGTLARAFNGLLSRLRSALAGQRRFMADASHELRTPLSVMRSAADVTLSQEHRTESEYREALTIVRDQATQVSRLVADMLSLARADADGYPLQRVSFYLDELIAACGRTVGVIARERDVRLSLPSPSEIPFTGDEELLQRMLMNVLQNAVRYSPAGGTVGLEVQSDASGVTIRVKDQGPGIPEADRERIFDRFVRVDTARGGDGAGLGLPIARWVAVAHGGSLDVEASDATGSTFRVWLPISTAS